MSEDPETKRMQVKVLYSFNNNPTVFLSRSKQLFPVKVAQIPLNGGGETDMITLGAFELKNCVLQITTTLPENFKLDQEDYVVYYKDITEQPDEPFVSNGNLTTIMQLSKTCLVPGRICQNLSTSYLFGDKSAGSALTLEIRLQLHVTELDESAHEKPQPRPQAQQTHQNTQINQGSVQQSQSLRRMVSSKEKRPAEHQYPSKKQRAAVPAAKATRTKSLPIFTPAFTNLPSFANALSFTNAPLPMHSIKNHDRLSVPKFDKSIQDRFKLAPFLMEKIVDKPVKRNWKQPLPQPTRAVRTRSMLNAPIFSSPINEVLLDPEDADYNGSKNDDEEEDFDEEEGDYSPYTPQQPYPQESKQDDTFQSLPDLEDLDSKKIHVIPKAKLPRHHGLVCVNSNCATKISVSWRYFEMEFSPDYFALLTAKEFRKEDYEGMFGPLCNACYLFFRNKGFMRPPHVVRKYCQQQRYKREVKNKEEETSLQAVAKKKSNQFASLPSTQPKQGKFLTPSHTPSAINQVIQNQQNQQNFPSSKTPTYNDLNDLMNQINNFGGPLTDIDIPADNQGVTPPMIATKSNTRVIDLYEDDDDEQRRSRQGTSDPVVDEENKENCPPLADTELDDFESMIAKSFQEPGKTSPLPQQDWINLLFPENSPKDSKTPVDEKDIQKSGFNKKGAGVNMPSSPFITSHDASDDLGTFLGTSPLKAQIPSSSPKAASRNDTLMTWNKVPSGSTPNSEIYSDDKPHISSTRNGQQVGPKA